MPRINFVVARTDEEAQSLANDGSLGASTLPEARNILKSLVSLQTTTPVALAPPGEFAIYGVQHVVKRLTEVVGDA
jgi:hypothetical protein